MDDATVKDIHTVIGVILAQTKRGGVRADIREAAMRLAETTNYHSIRTDVCFYRPEGTTREVPGILKSCTCGWASQPTADQRQANQEAEMHQLSTATEFDVD